MMYRINLLYLFLTLFTQAYIITGGASGVGLELAKLLYSKNASVYVAARSQKRADGGIDAIKRGVPKSSGALGSLVVDLADLSTIKPAVERFMRQAPRLDALFLNAGIMTPPAGSKTEQGHDLELGVHCLSGFLLARLLEPIMKATAALPDTPRGSVRVVWVASLLNLGTPPGGVAFDAQGNPVQLKAMDNYMQSKGGVYLLSHEFSVRSKDTGISHVSLHPGLMKTELQRYGPPPMRLIMGAVFKGPKYGAYTEMYAGLSPEAKNGGYYIPWGRSGTPPCHLVASTKSEGGKPSVASRFYEWCERASSDYA
jgi:retinol dehydrogenase-12